VVDFSTTHSGHGTQVVSSSATINAVKIGWVGKTFSTTTDGADSSIFRTPNGSGGTDTTMAGATYTTTDAYQETILSTTPTASQLLNCEAGFLKGAGTNTHTVEDMWVMTDYVPSPSAPGLMIIGQGNV
jgi:hypothetical protein